MVIVEQQIDLFIKLDLSKKYDQWMQQQFYKHKNYVEIGTWPDKQSLLEFMTLFLNYRLHARGLICHCRSLSLSLSLSLSTNSLVIFSNIYVDNVEDTFNSLPNAFDSSKVPFLYANGLSKKYLGYSLPSQYLWQRIYVKIR